MREKSKGILEHNCRECHTDIMHDIAPRAAGGHDDEVSCLHCHRTAGHGPTSGMGKFDEKEIKSYLEKYNEH